MSQSAGRRISRAMMMSGLRAQRAQAFGEVRSISGCTCVWLNAGLDHLDRILYRADIDLVVREAPQGGISVVVFRSRLAP